MMPLLILLNKKIQERTGYPPRQQNLLFKGKQWEDGRTLSLQFLLSLGEGMQIFHFSTGEILNLKVEQGETIKNIKEKIGDQKGYPPDKLRIVFAGKQLEDGKTLSGYNIQRKCILHVWI